MIGLVHDALLPAPLANALRAGQSPLEYGSSIVTGDDGESVLDLVLFMNRNRLHARLWIVPQTNNPKNLAEPEAFDCVVLDLLAESQHGTGH